MLYAPNLVVSGGVMLQSSGALRISATSHNMKHLLVRCRDDIGGRLEECPLEIHSKTCPRENAVYPDACFRTNETAYITQYNGNGTHLHEHLVRVMGRRAHNTAGNHLDEHVLRLQIVGYGDLLEQRATTAR